MIYRWPTGTWKKCSKSLVTREIANQNHDEVSLYNCQDGGLRTVGTQRCAANMEKSVKVSQNTKNRTYGPAIQLLGICPKEPKSERLPLVCSLQHNVWEQLKRPSAGRWVGKESSVRVCVRTIQKYNTIHLKKERRRFHNVQWHR